MAKVIVVKALGKEFPVDVDSWSKTFGTPASKAAVRKDVLEYFRYALDGLAVWDEVTPR